jgi:hypothetical protein
MKQMVSKCEANKIRLPVPLFRPSSGRYLIPGPCSRYNGIAASFVYQRSGRFDLAAEGTGREVGVARIQQMRTPRGDGQSEMANKKRRRFERRWAN